MNQRICSVDECGRESSKRAMCGMHYQRWRKHGETRGGKTERPLLGSKESALLFHGWTVEDSGCWEWSGPLSDGRGVINMDGQRGYAYRAAYEVWVGPIPSGHVVCHKCDNPICINPGHLLAGTQLENIDDMVSKDRSIHGIKNPHAVLSKNDVARVMNLIAAGIPQSRIAVKFGVARTTISAISTGRSWKREQAALHV